MSRPRLTRAVRRGLRTIASWAEELEQDGTSRREWADVQRAIRWALSDSNPVGDPPAALAAPETQP